MCRKKENKRTKSNHRRGLFSSPGLVVVVQNFFQLHINRSFWSFPTTGIYASVGTESFIVLVSHSSVAGLKEFLRILLFIYFVQQQQQQRQRFIIIWRNYVHPSTLPHPPPEMYYLHNLCNKYCTELPLSPVKLTSDQQWIRNRMHRGPLASVARCSRMKKRIEGGFGRSTRIRPRSFSHWNIMLTRFRSPARGKEWRKEASSNN